MLVEAAKFVKNAIEFLHDLTLNKKEMGNDNCFRYMKPMY